MTIISKTVSITLAKVIGDVILPHSLGTTEARYMDALQANKHAVETIFYNQDDIINTKVLS